MSAHAEESAATVPDMVAQLTQVHVELSRHHPLVRSAEGHYESNPEDVRRLEEEHQRLTALAYRGFTPDPWASERDSVLDEPPAAFTSPALHRVASEVEGSLQARVNRLERAVGTRRVVGQAQGILIERHGMSPERALGRLRAVSQHTGRGLHDVAAELIRTRQEHIPALRWVDPKPT